MTGAGMKKKFLGGRGGKKNCAAGKDDSLEGWGRRRGEKKRKKKKKKGKLLRLRGVRGLEEVSNVEAVGACTTRRTQRFTER